MDTLALKAVWLRRGLLIASASMGDFRRPLKQRFHQSGCPVSLSRL